jgi:hypothetical protein
MPPKPTNTPTTNPTNTTKPNDPGNTAASGKFPKDVCFLGDTPKTQNSLILSVLLVVYVAI